MNVYLAECLTYSAKHPVKVGISKNPYKRMRHLGQMGITCPGLRAIFVFSNEREARFVESQTCKKFKSIRYGSAYTKELLDASVEELSTFIKSWGPLYSIILEAKI
jgi:hypothetical protein